MKRCILMAGIMIAAIIATQPAFSQQTAPQQEATEKLQSKERDKLFTELRNAETEAQGRAVENRIWQYWMRGPNAEVGKLIKAAMDARRWYDFDKALNILDVVRDKAPDYAEGWNQRATVLFFKEKFDESLAAIDRALELEPKHFGALAGQARILMLQGRIRLAQSKLRQAVEIHPWLKERSFLIAVPENKTAPKASESAR